MELLVISYALAAFIVSVLVFGKFGRQEDRKNRRLNSISKKIDENGAYKELNQSFYVRFIDPAIKNISHLISNILPKKKGKSSKDIALLERQLRLSGMSISAQEFQFAKMAFMTLTMLLLFFVLIIIKMDVLYKLLIGLVGMVIAVMGPTLLLRSKISSYQQAIREQLPDALDLLSVCVEAGLSFDASLLKVSEKLSGPFIDELLIVYREIQMGRTRTEALHNLSDSSDIPELKTFAAALAQAGQLGIPINNVMKVQSDQLRVSRKQIAKEKGMKAPIKMMLPMVLLIFPVLFIILMGPTALNLIQQFGGG